MRKVAKLIGEEDILLLETSGAGDPIGGSTKNWGSSIKGERI